MGCQFKLIPSQYNRPPRIPCRKAYIPARDVYLIPIQLAKKHGTNRPDRLWKGPGPPLEAAHSLFVGPLSLLLVCYVVAGALCATFLPAACVLRFCLCLSLAGSHTARNLIAPRKRRRSRNRILSRDCPHRQPRWSARAACTSIRASLYRWIGRPDRSCTCSPCP